MNTQERNISGSTLFLGNAAFAMSCILLILSIADKPLGFFRGLALLLLAVATPILAGQYFMQFVFTGYTGNILVSAIAVGMSVAAYCALVWSIRWWAGILFTLTAWYYFVYVVRRMHSVLSRFAPIETTPEDLEQSPGAYSSKAADGPTGNAQE